MSKPTPDYSKIPSIQSIDQYLKSQGCHYGKEKRGQINDRLTQIRNNEALLLDPKVTKETLLANIRDHLQRNPNTMIPVINGTGAIIHTNLGRSVFSKEIFLEITDIASSYTNLEFSLETGKRGARLNNVADLLKTMTAAEEAVIVNNNAAAVLLTLIAFAAGKEVVVSRGELIEIGGSFRIPEVIEVSGAKLIEVGATNRTRVSDYENALTDQTAVLLKAHTSNYSIVGFTESVNTSDLASLSQKHNLILVEDIGSGALTEFDHSQLNSDPLIPLVLKDGADIITISGDKLIGGPQSGIILGKKSYLDTIKKHPLYRALRCDKLTMLLLEKTLLAHARNQQKQKIPTQKMLNESAYAVKKRANQIIKELDSGFVSVTKCNSTPGGGSLPGKLIPSWGIKLQKKGWNEDLISEFLRKATPPVIGRAKDGNVVLDCRTILDHQISDLQLILKKFCHY